MTLNVSITLDRKLLKQYKELGRLSDVEIAMRKSIITPLEGVYDLDQLVAWCPFCGKEHWNGSIPEYCPDCGQHIKWPDAVNSRYG